MSRFNGCDAVLMRHKTGFKNNHVRQFSIAQVCIFNHSYNMAAVEPLMMKIAI